MADIGVLNLQIKDNSERAAGGLDQLTGALERVKQAVAGGFSLSTVSTAVTRLAQNIAKNNATPAIKNLTALFNALSQFKKLGDIEKINVKPLIELKEAIGDGFKVGQVGTQMEKLRNAFKDGFVSDEAIGSIEKLHNTIQLFGSGDDARKVGSMAQALNKYAEASQRVNTAVGDWRMAGGLQDQKKSLFPLNLQQFGRKKKDSVAGEGVEQLKMDLDSLMRVNFDAIAQDTAKEAEAVQDLNVRLVETKDIVESVPIQAFAQQNIESLRMAKEQIDALFGESAEDAWIAKLHEQIDQTFDTTKISEFMNLVRETIEWIRTPVGRGTWDDIRDSVEETHQYADAFYHTSERTNEIIQNMGWSAHHTAEEFRDMLFAWMDLQSAMRLGSGSNAAGFLGTGYGDTSETGTSWFNPWGNVQETGWTVWKDGAIEVEGTVTDAMETIGNLGESTMLRLEAGAARAVEEVKNLAAAEAEAVRVAQEAKFYEDNRVSYSMERTNAMANDLTQLDLLKAKLRDAERQYNEFVNTLGASDTKTIKAGIAVADLRNKIFEYKEALEETANRIKENGMEKVAEYMNMSKIDLMTQKAHAMEETLAQDMERGKLSTAQEIARVTQIQNLYAQIDKMKMQEAKAQMEQAMAMQNASDQIGQLRDQEQDTISVTQRLTDSIRTMFREVQRGTLGRLISQFARIAKYRFLRSVIKQITDGFREGTQNYYEYSKAISSSFAPAMDDAATALQQMKNSIGAAVAPLLQTLVPVLQVVVQWFITATNYVNQFLSLLRGQATWSRALPEPASAFEKTTKAAKGTAKAMKDLLADWDELNIIQSETGGNGSGGNQQSTQEYLNMFEEVDEYAQEIKDAIKFIDDTFGGILPLLKKIGIAILGWKFGRQFSGLLGAPLHILAVKMADRLCNTLDFAKASKGRARRYLEKGRCLFRRLDQMPRPELIRATLSRVESAIAGDD